MEALSANGIPAVRAYPAGKIPMLTSVQAAVSLERLDQEEGLAAVKVDICCPASMGGGMCEDTAVRAGILLQAMGGRCAQSGCHQLGHTQLLCVEVSASFRGYETETGWTGIAVTLAGAALERVSAVKSWRSIGEAASLGDAVWKFRIEQELLPGASEGTAITEPFTLTVTRGARNETYGECRLTYHRCELDSGGLRRILQGFAASRTVNG